MSKLKIAIIRGRHLNPYEMQSYFPLVTDSDLTGFTSLTSLNFAYPFPVVRLPSWVDGAYGLRNIIPARYSLGILNRILVDAHYLFGLEKKLSGFDIAHSADTHYHFTTQCLNAKRHGYVKKVVVTVWENIPFNHETIAGRHEMKQRAIREIDLFIATSQQAKAALITEGVNKNKIKVIYPGIDLNRFKAKKTQPQKANRLLFVGRLVAEKGIWLILHTFLRLYQKNRDLTLCLCGDGEEKPAIFDFIQEKGIEHAVNIESVAYPDVPKVYKQADIFLLASHATKFWQEQFGMVLIEAMASGVPIVATRSGSIPEIVGDAAVIVSEHDAQGYFRQTEKVLKDATLRRKLAKLGVIRARKLFNAQKTSQRILSAYEELMMHE